jgi:2-hydroxychromene-2-carboxylate isomerase
MSTATAGRRPPRAAPRPTLYFSFRSPYSWLALRKLRAAVPDLDAELDCCPYWDPDPQTSRSLQERGGEFHYQQMSRAKHLYMLLDTKRLAAAEDVPMAWPIDIDSWWELPHLAWLYARGAGRAWPLYDAVVDARWGRGDDICDPRVLARAAGSAGLDPQATLAAADDPAIRGEAVDCLYQAYRDDIFGIPYIKWGHHRFWGLDRVDTFLAARQQAAEAVAAR